MDPYEATKVVFSRIQNLDPENASRIMGLLLIQDHGEKELIRLAFGPENLLHSVVFNARQVLGICPNMPSTSPTPSSPSPFLSHHSNNNSSNSNSNNPFSRHHPQQHQQKPSISTSTTSTPSRLFIPTALKISTSLACPSSTSSPSWRNSILADDLISPKPSTTASNNGVITSKGSSLNPATPPFYCASNNNGLTDLMDEIQLQEQLSFLNDSSPTVGPNNPDPYYLSGLPQAHRRSCSVSDINLGSLMDDPINGLGWKPCHYYARGFCKNGSTCRFVHDSDGGGHNFMGSPSKLEMMEQCHELLRSKSMHQHKLMAALGSGPGSPSGFPYKGISWFAQQQQNDSPRGAAAAAAALMMGEDLHNFSRSRIDNGRAESNPALRQIYLTFPADSTFREEVVSNYFSIYGPVQDVRIPYQQKRMFGFVTFVYPETVKLILAKGNPHFVCDARVLVKPYKEKGKVPDKFRKQQQQQPIERGEFSACNSPTALDSRDLFDLQLGSRTMYDTQYLLWRRKLEEHADLQHTLELQSRRMMGLQLLDVKRNHHHHRSLSTGAPIPSPTQSPNSIFHQPLLGSDRSSPDASDEICDSPPLNDGKQALRQVINEATDRGKEGSVGEDNTNYGNDKEGPCREDNNVPESFEHNLPDSPFASPTKGAVVYVTAFSGGNEAESATLSSANNNVKASSFVPASSTLDLSPFKSCYFQMPRFSPGHGALGM